MEKDLEDDLRAAQRQIDNQVEEQQKLIMDEEKAKFDREMLLQGKNLSEEEFERLMREHKQQMAALQQNYLSEKDRQKQAIADKVGGDSQY